MTARLLAPVLGWCALGLCVLGLCAMAIWPGVAAAGGPADLYYERSLMSVAGARCKLFDPSISGALTASARQARGAALRAGADPDALDVVERRADDRAAGVACNSADLATAAKRVRTAFAGYATMNIMSFPGGLAAWRANRGQTNGAGAAWRLAQNGRAPSGAATLGIAHTDDGMETLTAVAAWPGSLAASGARLVVRDLTRAPRPYLDPRRKELVAQIPPRAATRTFLASDKTLAAPGLLPTGAASGAAFRFTTATAQALQGLDPREAVMLEVVYPTLGGERVESVPFEVGDFAAGVAFLSAKR